MVDCREADVSAKGQEKRNLVNKEDVHCEENFFVELEKLSRNSEVVTSHGSRLGAGCLAFKRRDILAPDFGSGINVKDSDGTILDLIATYDPFEIIHGWVA